MATAEEMRRMREFFGPQTYGDQDPNAMPDMYHEIDPTSESYLGTPVDEYGEKTNPTGRSIDRALRRFFGSEIPTMPLADNMVSLDEGGEDFAEDSLSRADEEFEADTLGEEGLEEILANAMRQDDEMVETDDYALATAGPTPESLDERGEDYRDPELAQGPVEDFFRSTLGLGGDSEPFMDASDANDRVTKVPGWLMAAIGPAKVKSIVSALQSGGSAAQKLLQGSIPPRQLAGTAQRQIPGPNRQITASPQSRYTPTPREMDTAFRQGLMRSGVQNLPKINRATPSRFEQGLKVFGGKMPGELRRRALGRGEFGKGGLQRQRLPQFLKRFFE